MTETNGRILVADDNRLNRMKLMLSLEQQGHSVRLAEDGRQALDMLRAETFDVMLLDILMPEMDGYQVLEQVRGDPQLRDLPVIVISALDEIESAVRCIEMGAEDYLPKPFDPVLLRARLNASLQKKHLRDLEKAYLRQEVTLRQNEKLATLGRLSAGLAHELNNPAAAVQRGAAQLQAAFDRLRAALLRLGAGLSAAQLEAVRRADQDLQARARAPVALDALTRSDREASLEAWLEARGAASAWEAAPVLAGLGYTPDDLETLGAGFDPAARPALFDWLALSAAAHSLLDEVRQGAGRMSEIVKALKSYTYLDQAPIQNVDVHAGLESTLVILRSKLQAGVTIAREYDPDLPRIEAFGSELNQVWTNLIDNAIDAIASSGGQGRITLRTRTEQPWVVVEIEDDGPGIPAEIQASVFDAFFTTKAPGQGTGLGLNISHNIICQRHHGRFDLASQPGQTCFTVRLPLTLNAAGGAA